MLDRAAVSEIFFARRRKQSRISSVIHPATELRFVSDQVGYGVFAAELIPHGTVTWAGDDFDQEFPLEQVQAMEPFYRQILDRYAFVDNFGRYILCWDIARYVNHSCEANCMSPGGCNFEVALRDIQPGEQLTDDYGTLNLDVSFACACGSSRCRSPILPEDILQYADGWDVATWSALRRLPYVAQPLWPAIKQGEKDQVERVLTGEISPASCRVNYHPHVTSRLRAKTGAHR
jgi:hypothetical protein